MTNFKKFSLLVLFIIVFFNSCAQGKAEEGQNGQAKTSQNNALQKNKVGYIVHINALSPYELYLDDILIDSFFGNNISNTVDLNPYLLKNGKHHLSIKFFAKEDSKDNLLSPRDIQFN